MDHSVEGAKKLKKDSDHDDHKKLSSHQASTPLNPAHHEELLRPSPDPPPVAFVPHRPPGESAPRDSDLDSSLHSFAGSSGRLNALGDMAAATNQGFGEGITDTNPGMGCTPEPPSLSGAPTLIPDGKADLHLSDQDSDLINILDFHPATKGSFADIFIAFHLPSGHKLAMKRPRSHGPSDSTSIFRRLVREAATWSTFKHPNIVPCFGLVNIRSDVYLVSPWMQLGDLFTFVQDHIKYVKEGKLSSQSVHPAHSKFNEAKTVGRFVTF